MGSDQEKLIAQAFPAPYTLDKPKGKAAPILFDSPHSGRNYPDFFLKASRLDAMTLRRSEDFFVDQLFAAVPMLGANFLRAEFPRAFLDVNREPYELDPSLISGKLPRIANTRSIRVAGGLGTIPRVVTEGRNIYHSKITYAEALARIKWLHLPYHRKLTTLLDAAFADAGFAVLIDCHSMPSLAGSDTGGQAIDFVLGDRFGSSCSAKLTRLVRDKLTSLGYFVVLNKPYAGGYITEKYGDPRHGIHALQIEINRALYLSEDSLRKTRGFKKLQADLTELSRTIIATAPALLAPPTGYQAAAE